MGKIIQKGRETFNMEEYSPSPGTQEMQTRTK